MIVYVLETCNNTIINGVYNTLEEAIRGGERNKEKNKVHFVVFEISKRRNSKRLVFESMN